MNSASPMNSFMHSISHTKANILRRGKTGRSHSDDELKNIQAEIGKIEKKDAITHDDQHATWLRALDNRRNALLRQQNIYWGQRAKLQWMTKDITTLVTSTTQLKFTNIEIE